MKEEAAYIDRSYKTIPATDFKLLLDEGITAIQKMAGDNWTDYNIHDPGVTILEQLCYALTELGYRANFKFEDLLASQSRETKTLRNATYHEDSFYTAAFILHSGPVTIKDYRKAMIDKIFGLRNIWIEPLNVSKGQSQINGVYLAFAEASSDKFDINDEPKYKEQIKKLEQDIWDYMAEHTNWGEAFEKVVILKPTKIKIQAAIELNYEADVDEVHANVMFALRKSMTRPMVFHKLQTLLDQGKNINEIFEGPKLDIGFVNDDQLKKRVQVLYAATFLNAIRSIKGILFVQSLFILNEDNSTCHTKYIDINNNPVLGNLIDDAKTIKYIKHGEEITVNFQKAKKFYDALDAQDKVQNNYEKSTKNDLPIPTGLKKDIGSHYSFQNHFPAIYGLGKMGVPTMMDNEKKTAIMQLKGYLMFFDQIMANYFAQLKNFSELFSFNQHLSQSYFGGTIDEMKDINKMVDTFSSEDYSESALKSIVQKALNTIDNFDDRRNRFLDHLLARFGERIGNYGITFFNTYFFEKENKQRQINIKINLLKNITEISKNRGQSFDYGKPYWDTENMSPMEKKIRILLGLETKKNITVEKQNRTDWHKNDHRQPFDLINIISNLNADQITPIHSALTYVTIKNSIVPVDESSINHIILDKEIIFGVFKDGKLAVTSLIINGSNKFVLLYNKEINGVPASYHQKLMDEVLSLFRSVENKKNLYWFPGIHENYVFEFKNDKDNIYDELSEVWKQIGIFDTHEDAMDAARMLFTHVRDLHMGNERFYIVDHILLRPRQIENKYGVHFYDENKNVEINSTEQFSINELMDATLKLTKNMYGSTPKARKNRKEQFMASMIKDGKEVAYSKQTFAKEEEAITHAESVKLYFKDFTELNFYDKEIIKFYKNYEKGADMKGSDYSFRITVVLPNWTLRFSESEFRIELENTFRLECPAHIGIDFKWLDLEEMIDFENIYQPWLEALRNENEKIGDLNILSNKIMQFIKFGSEQDDMIGYLSHKDFTTA